MTLWLASFSALAETSLPIGHYPLPETGNIVGEAYTVQVEDEEDTLLDIAHAHGIGYEEIRRANPKTSLWVPGKGTQVQIPAQHILPDVERTGVVINIAELRLYYYPEAKDGETPRVETYPIGIGRDGFDTPLGITKTTMRLEDPAWYPPESVRQEAAERGDPPPDVVPPGPDNPLGQHAILLDIPGYLIHGTNQPDGIGMRASRGCIRMHPDDIEAVFEQIPNGTQVNIIDEPIKLGWDADHLPYLQAFTSLNEKETNISYLLGIINNADELTEKKRSNIDYEVMHNVLRQSS
ncbi:L,D-transpeptidase family protein [Halomonas sp. CSM-2]|uniref:L,D-transpeptidase family protein n=1 Tax=Halomonas sp. CSM-2 TaxID=1975722 RepID=UPI0020CB169A|nr:L,D-transpeptidase family protein [Halomonas sp. CSM-2]